MRKVVRRVMNSDGQIVEREITLGLKADADEPIYKREYLTDVKPCPLEELDEELLEELTDKDLTPAEDIDLVNAMSLEELKATALANGFRVGNRGLVKARAFVIKQLGLDEL